MAFHSENVEVQDDDDEDDEEIDDINYGNVETKTTTQQKHPQKKRSVRRRYRMLGMGLGLLCGVQALLNIALRLSLYNDLIEQNNALQSRYNSVTAERDELKRSLCESRGFTYAGGMCYYISTEYKTWKQSRQYCRDNQSDLMVINGKEKQDFVNRVVNSSTKWVWLGLTDREGKGQWKWVDGTQLTTPTYWRHGEPNNTEQEGCAVFYNGAERGWIGVACSAKIRWICETII